MDADALGGLLFFADVGDGGGIVADADKGDSGLFPGERSDLAGEFFNNGFCDGVSVDYLHGNSKAVLLPFVNPRMDHIRLALALGRGMGLLQVWT